MTGTTATPPLSPGPPPTRSAWTALYTGLDRDRVPSAAHLTAIATEDVRRSSASVNCAEASN